MQAFSADVGKFVAEHKEHPTLGPSVKKLGEAQNAVTKTAMQLLMWFQTGNVGIVPLVSTRFQEMMSELCVGWLLLQAAVVAEKKIAGVSADHPDHAFYTGKRHAAVYYAQNVLPAVLEKAAILSAEDKSALEIPLDAFASV